MFVRRSRIVRVVLATVAAASMGALAAPDVIVAEITGPSNYGTASGIAAYSLGTTACNIGDAVVPWVSNTNDHPVTTQNLYRLANGRFEQIGQAWVVHGICATQGSLCATCISGPGCAGLGAGCSTPDSSGFNGAQGGMGPKSEVNANTGVFPYPWVNNGTGSGVLFKRLQAAVADVDPALNPGALYFVSSMYLQRADSLADNDNNNQSYRACTFSPATFQMSLTGTTQRQRPAIQAWRDQDPSVLLSTIDVPGDGRFLLACKVVSLGGGQFRYTYALQNLTADRGAQSFSIPFPVGTTITNPYFHDVNYHSGEPYSGADWTASISSTSISWATQTFAQNPNANALRWDTLYSFGFDANLPPAAINANILLFKTGTPVFVTGATCGPGNAAQLIASDSFAYSPPGSPLESYPYGGSGFTGEWYEDNGNWIVQAGTMSYSNGPLNLAVTGGRVRTSVAEARRVLTLPGGLLGNTPGTIWISMLAQQISGTPTNCFGGLSLTTASDPNTFIYLGKRFSIPNWGINAGSGSTPLDSGILATASAFLVLRVDFHAGADDIYLWINPPLAVEPNVGTANIAAPAYKDIQNINALLLHAGATGGSITMDIDEIRLGRTFADVAPTVSGPPNDECAAATPVPLGTHAFDTTYATTSAGAACGSIGSDLWYSHVAAATGTLSIDTCAQAPFDTVLAVYTACGGALLACNDDMCSLQSRVSFCATAGTTYFIRLGGFAGTRGSGTFTIATSSSAPTLAAAATPSCGGPTTPVTITANLASPGCPPRTITNANANAAVLDAGTVPLLDDGVFPDVTAGDGIFTGTAIVGPNAATGNIVTTANLGVVSLSLNTLFTVPFDEAGDTPATALPYTGGGSISGVIGDASCGGNDADVYIIGISNPLLFSATTVGGAAFDTQLFLFDRNGIGVSANDDNPAGGVQSTLTSAFVPLTPGLYYLAISAYNKDPRDAMSDLLWNNTPFNVERAPDGPGAPNPFAVWDNGPTNPGGPYTIAITGAKEPAKEHECLVGWLGMDDVCPSVQEMHDYGKGAANATVSPTPPRGLPNEYVTHAAEFPAGQNSYITMNNSTHLLDFPASGPLSLTAMAWVSPYAGGTASMPIIDALGTGTRGYRFYLVSSGTDWIPTLDLALGGTPFPPITSGLRIPTSAPGNRQWINVAVAFSWSPVSSGTLNVRFDVSSTTNGTPGTFSIFPLTGVSNTGPVSTTAPRVGANLAGNQFYSGGMDELQVYNCALDGNEVSAIQNAGSSGVAKIKVFAPWETASKGAGNTDITGVVVSEWDPDIRLTYKPGPSAGSGAFCSRAGFIGGTITPSTMLGLGREIRTFTISIPGTSSRFTGHACYTVFATNLATGATTSHMGSVVDHPVWWADLKPVAGNEGFKQVQIQPPLNSASWTFRLRNNTPPPSRTINYKFQALRSDMSPGNVPITLSLAGGGSGNPVFGTATVSGNSTIDLPVITATIANEQGTSAIYEIVLFADIDASGTITDYEDIASSALMAEMSPYVPPPCAPGTCHGVCVADFDDGSSTGMPDGGVTIDDLLYYLFLFENGLPCADVDDGSFSGMPDGGVTIDDLLYYLFRFENGC